MARQSTYVRDGATVSDGFAPQKNIAKPSTNIFSRFQKGFERLFLRFRESSHSLLEQLVLRRKLFVPTFLLLCVCAFVLVPFLGQDFRTSRIYRYQVPTRLIDKHDSFA